MRIPTLGALTLVTAAAVVALPTTADAALPTAGADSATTTQGVAKTIPVLGNDTNPDAGEPPLVVTSQTNGAHGTASCTSAGACTYTPAAGWVGTDTFTYTISADNGTETATGQVTVTTAKIGTMMTSSTPANLLWKPRDAKTGAAFHPTLKIVGSVNKPNGAAMPDTAVELWWKPLNATSYTKLSGPFNTDEFGKVSTVVETPTSRTSYRWQAGPMTAVPRTLSVTPSLTMATSPRKLGKSHSTTPSSTTISGWSGPARGGATVQLQKRSATGVWENVMPTTFETPDADGYAHYSFSVPQPTSGEFTYRVVVPADTGRNSVTSGLQNVQVYDANITNVQPSNTDEFVTIKNVGGVALNLSKWVVSQGSHTVTLPAFGLGADSSVRIHSGRGRSDRNDLYLRGSNGWAATGTVTLTDSREIVMDTYPN